MKTGDKVIVVGTDRWLLRYLFSGTVIGTIPHADPANGVVAQVQPDNDLKFVLCETKLGSNASDRADGYYLAIPAR